MSAQLVTAGRGVTFLDVPEQFEKGDDGLWEALPRKLDAGRSKTAPGTSDVAMPLASRKHLAVLVHGLGSSPACWDGLLRLLRSDIAVTNLLDFCCFEYDSRWMNLSLQRRIGGLAEAGDSLKAFLDKPELARYRTVTLVGHSQGGLVIQQYLHDKVRRGEAAHLARIRQVVLVATPNFGSSFISPVRRALSTIFTNPQERALRLFDPEMGKVHAVVRDQIEDAPGKSPSAWPVPFQCFWGSQDAIVGEASARGLFHSGNAVSLEGDHSSVIAPATRDDENYKRLADALVEPAGHVRVYEIDLFEQLVKVEPLDGLTPISARYGDRERVIETDNRAEIVRAVTFSRKNRCESVFPLWYKTKNDGFIVPTMSHANEAPPEETADWKDRGTECIFKFIPQAGETYRLKADVYKGFDPGHRDLHCHLGTDRYYKRIRVRLDLTAYAAAGWSVTRAPQLFLHKHDPKDHQFCGLRDLGTTVDPTSAASSGLWEWELRDLTDGVLDLLWDVTPGTGLTH